MQNMVKRRVICNYFNEESKLKAQDKIENAKVTDSFIVGDIDEQDIPLLEKEKGLIVQIVQSKNSVITPGKMSSNNLRELNNASLEERSLTMDQNKSNFYVIELDGPLLKEWKQEINDLGVRLISSIPYNNYLSKSTADQIKNLRKLDFVKNVSLYDKSDTRLVEDYAYETSDTKGMERMEENLKYHAILHDKNDLEKTTSWFKANEIHVESAYNDIITFTAKKNNQQLLDSVRGLPEISEVQQDFPFETYNDFARLLLHIDNNSTSGIVNGNFSDGDGQIIGVLDSGIDKEHSDFKDRIISAIREVKDLRPNDTNDYNGHGTHVSGSILGDGTKSNKKIRGIVPKAKLFFQSVGGEGRSIIIPTNERDFFELCDRAYNSGVRIYSNSWGSNLGSIYYISSRFFDGYALQHPDFLFVVAAGNDGEAISRKDGRIELPLYSKEGYVDWFSIGSPGTCKNGLTVGATRSTRQDGPNKDVKWGDKKKEDPGTHQEYKPFPDPPISEEKVCGNPDSMAAFSSRGPVEPRRIKPDVVAPGTDILSTRSSLDPSNNFDSNYIFKSGTSMATPLVSGCAALVREYYTKNRNHNPSAALIKATIINGSRWLGGIDSIADHDKIPNQHQGFGMVDMINTIPNKQSPNLKLEFVDTWIYKDNSRKIMETGKQKKYRIKTSNSKFLKICMTYNDRPSVGLENNLNLFLYDIETQEIKSGNEQIQSGSKYGDPDNNVEVIRVENPLDRTYEISVRGKNLIDENLDFSLVVSGENISSLVEVE
jgi:serine protease AprX